jgi:hypothetical protein
MLKYEINLDQIYMCLSAVQGLGPLISVSGMAELEGEKPEYGTVPVAPSLAWTHILLADIQQFNRIDKVRERAACFCGSMCLHAIKRDRALTIRRDMQRDPSTY